VDTADYCRELERYLCQKNDGHLIRIVGPSFDLVSRWAADGVPLKVTFRGIDRYFERYYRKGPRRRPVRVDFCEADVLDVFDEWRRATGLTGALGDDAAAGGASDEEAGEPRRGPSLPAHLERALRALTNARATNVLGPEADAIIDRISGELDVARASARGVRGEARRALIERLAASDSALLRAARAALDDEVTKAMEHDAAGELAPYHESMSPEALTRAHEAIVDRLVRERFRLPILRFD
jgi:hypothetical protein